MGILPSSKEDQIIQLIRLDKPIKLKEFLLNNNINPNELYTKRKRTLIQLCCYYSSPKCLSKLISMNYDYNKKEISNNYTPLYIACKFNCLKIVKILLEKDDCNILQKTNDNYNELEIAFLKGNYDICYYLLYEYKNKKIDSKKMKLNENKDKIDINIKVDGNNETDKNDNDDDIYTNLDANRNNEEKKKEENTIIE
jgi:ankyrin repeat protein